MWRLGREGAALLTLGFPFHSDSLQLLLRPQRLQPVPGRRPRLQVRVVRRAERMCVRGPVQQRHLRVPAACHRQGGPGGLPSGEERAPARPGPAVGSAGLCRFQIQPETGPLGGGIRVTILGSNLGVRADDVKRVTVAGRNCAFDPERYSVSTR